MSVDEESRQSQFSDWLNQQLLQRGWTQGKLINQSGSIKEERLSSTAVSRYCTGKMLPDTASCQKITRAFDLPVELVLQRIGVIFGTSRVYGYDWLQQAINNLAYAVEVGQLAEEVRLLITSYLYRERRLQELERTKEWQNERREETKHYSPS